MYFCRNCEAGAPRRVYFLGCLLPSKKDVLSLGRLLLPGEPGMQWLLLGIVCQVPADPLSARS